MPNAADPVSPFVGRQREIARLSSCLHAARAGHGQFVLLAGEPGIGKTRLAQEFAGAALASGTAVAWGRCIDGDWAPPLWPWRQAMRSLGLDPDEVFAGSAESPQDRFRFADALLSTLRATAGPEGLAVILDDLQWADSATLHALRHLLVGLPELALIVVATQRTGAPSGPPAAITAELARAASERIELVGFDLAQVADQLGRLAGTDAAGHAVAVLDRTAGNPYYVLEIGRALADGTWRFDEPPRAVVDVVGARLAGLTPRARDLLRAAAVLGLVVPLGLVAAVLRRDPEDCAADAEEAAAHGLLERLRGGECRFVHALTRDAVLDGMPTTERVSLHRAAALATERLYAGDPTGHAADIARHWAAVAPYGAAEQARYWAIAAARAAVTTLAFAEGVRHYGAALGSAAAPLEPAARAALQIELARAAYLAGDMSAWTRAAADAASSGRAAQRPQLVAEAALALEPSLAAGGNALAEQLCAEALALTGLSLGVRARLLALRSRLAFYAGDTALTDQLSRAALDQARASGADHAVADALRARHEALPGPRGRSERLEVARELVDVSTRIASPRTRMWGLLWKVDALLERGLIPAAADELAGLHDAVHSVGGPVPAWHHLHTAACVAQAQARFAEAATMARSGYQRMRLVEPQPASGVYLGLLAALAMHVRPGPDALALTAPEAELPPQFAAMGRLAKAAILAAAGQADDAASCYDAASDPAHWSFPPFYAAQGLVIGARVACALSRVDDVVTLVDLMVPLRAEHAVGGGVSYMGPLELGLGIGYAVLGRHDDAVAALEAAARVADRSGTPAFAAEARHHLAAALRGRAAPGDAARAAEASRRAGARIRQLGMTAYATIGEAASVLSEREEEVAALVAEGLTNPQIARRLVISERTAQNHVQHILTKLGFGTRSQIATWQMRRA